MGKEEITGYCLLPVVLQVSGEEMAYARQQLDGLTFGTIHGQVLMSDTQDLPNPFTRVLEFQYK